MSTTEPEPEGMIPKTGRFPRHIARIIEKLAEKKGSSESEVIRALVEDQLGEREYMTDLDAEVKAELRSGD